MLSLLSLPKWLWEQGKPSTAPQTQDFTPPGWNCAFDQARGDSSTPHSSTGKDQIGGFGLGLAKLNSFKI